MTLQAPQIPADVRERIIAAATDLFEQSGRETMPTVDAVRRAARVDMNAASAVMKEWRRAQTAQAAPVAVAVPEVVQQASSAATATIWQQAQELANESLRSAQAAWETERAELDAMRQELAEAFERQAGELDATTAELAAEKAAAEKLAQELTAVRQELAAAQEQAHTAEARAQEIERRAGELRTELDRAHQDADQARAQLDQVRGELAKVQARADADQEAHQEQRKQAAAEAHRMAERLTAAQAERDQAMKAAGQAREEAARMAGQLDTLKEQSAALLARITPPAAEVKPTRKKPDSGE
ncbi:DNA-binding protein [Salmonella enterica subsp. enterica serovar Worthington]|nr:KfrA protein [Salmonella enterica]ECH8371080.1 KfrA protein [Salmonella enterica subsp. enterica serovar Agona]EJP6600572.1 DNA-binding protein [Escherichia coli]EKZ8381506.1 DNA-binding protein [Salmonella enterica subsp. enterica serovar Worthington]EDM8647039.1 KfrA protein [Salmonella enterica subsp. enterica serovar Agona]